MLLTFLQITRYLMCIICKTGIKYTDTNESSSNILYFDVNVTFYFFLSFIFAIKSIINGPECQTV